MFFFELFLILDLNQPVIVKKFGKGYFNLTCLSAGNPAPTYSWMANNFFVGDAVIYTTALNTSYSVDYKCIVENSAGSLSSKMSGGLTCK